MPVVEKIAGGRVVVRGIGEFSPGDRADVSEADAAYLCDDRGDFQRVDENDGSDLPDDRVPDEDLAAMIDEGLCPWCDEYEGDAVGQHASAAHPDEWAAYKED